MDLGRLREPPGLLDARPYVALVAGAHPRHDFFTREVAQLAAGLPCDGIRVLEHDLRAAEHVAGVREAFGVPSDHTPNGAITVGHRAGSAGPRGSAARRERRTDVVHRGRW